VLLEPHHFLGLDYLLSPSWNKKNRDAVLSLWQPGYLQETRGFPSPPCGRFGLSYFVKNLAAI
jgi:thymidylate synthase